MTAGLTVETVTRSRKVVSTREHLVMARQLEMEWPDTPPIYSIDNVVTGYGSRGEVGNDCRILFLGPGRDIGYQHQLGNKQTIQQSEN